MNNAIYRDNKNKKFIEYASHLLNENNQLKKEIETLKKALALACKTYYEECGEEDCPCGEYDFVYKLNRCDSCESQDGHSQMNKDGRCWYNYYIELARRC